jgi:hypothetical protein
MVQVERDKITRLKDQYSREIAVAVDTATKARDNVFALQNKRLHAAEKEKEDLVLLLNGTDYLLIFLEHIILTPSMKKNVSN